MQPRRFLALCLVACIAWGLCSPAPAAPILEFLFNETGTTAPSTGLDSTPLTLRNAAGVATDLHSAPGLGVTGGLGLPGSDADRAFDNTASTGMGSGFTGGRASQPDNDAIDALVSFTLSGWFKTAGSAGINNFARLFVNNDGASSAGYHLLAGDAAGELRPKVDGTETADVSGWGATQKWVFFALTYDGTATTGNLKLYRGYRNPDEAGGDPAVELVATISVNQGTVNDEASGLGIGNRSNANDRPFDGYLDNMRIDGTKIPGDASGALSLAALESRRQADVGVPEPATALLTAFGLVALVRRRRRTR